MDMGSRCLFLRRNERGAAMLEFTIVIFLVITLTLGIAEFSFVFFQWNAASKAVQAGARLAAVSDPVYEPFEEIDTLVGGSMNLGDSLIGVNVYDEITCVGSTQRCNNRAQDYSEAAMDILINGRNNDPSTTEAGGLPGMRTIFWRVEEDNVNVRYTHTGLGFAGRPGGPVPTVTVELVGLNYDFIFLDGLLGLGPIPLTTMRTTITGEDLSVASPF